jgi:hypothetical protein
MASIDRLRIKIQRAEKHVRDLKAEIEAFFNTKPYAIGTKRNPQTRQLIYYLTSVREVPERIAAIAGDVLQNLRSALDHLAYRLFMVGKPPGTPAKHVYFPISDNAAKYRTESPGKVKGMRQDAIDAIKAFKPYKGGNDTLWIIHKLNNIDKHRFVLLVGSAFNSFDAGAHVFGRLAANSHPAFAEALAAMEPLHLFLCPADRMFPLKAGDELFIDGPDAETITGAGGWMDQLLLLDGPYIKDGFVQVTDKRGLGVELN